MESCRYLSRSSYPINLSDAISRGYTACSICKPTTSVTSNARQTQTTQQKTTHGNVQQAQTVQCSATTKAGSQCKRMTKSSNGLCWQHGGGN